MAAFTNDPNMSGRLVKLFRDLENQNLSIILDSIDTVKILQQFWRSQRRRNRGGVGTKDELDQRSTVVLGVVICIDNIRDIIHIRLFLYDISDNM